MKEIEHVLKRVVSIDSHGNRCKLKERQFAVAKAIAEWTNNPDKGVQLAISAIAASSFKKRSTVSVALAELEELGVIRRDRGGPHDTHIFRFAQILIEAAVKSRPYQGPPIIFPQSHPANANSCQVNALETGTDTEFLAKPDTQPLDIQDLGGNCKGTHPPPAPRPPPDAIGPPATPEGGRAVFAPQRKNALKENFQFGSDIFGLDHFEEFQAQKFFEWLSKHGISHVHIDGMPRKKNGDRGAGIAQFLGFKHPVKTEIAVQALTNLGVRMARDRKKRVDLQVRAAELPQELSNLILIDDLDVSAAQKLKGTCSVPGAILETSAGNYQAVLLWNFPLNRAQRLAAQRHFVWALGADEGAMSPIQLHRFPGAPNFKNGGLFVTRLSEYFMGDGPPIDLEAATATINSERRKMPSEPACDGIRLDNSSEAMKWTLWALTHGKSHGEILNELGCQWLKHHDALDWPKRTLAKALVYLSQRPRLN